MKLPTNYIFLKKYPFLVYASEQLLTTGTVSLPDKMLKEAFFNFQLGCKQESKKDSAEPTKKKRKCSVRVLKKKCKEGK